MRSLIGAALIATIVYALEVGGWAGWRVFCYALAAYCLSVAVSIGWHAFHTGDWSG